MAVQEGQVVFIDLNAHRFFVYIDYIAILDKVGILRNRIQEHDMFDADLQPQEWRTILSKIEFLPEVDDFVTYFFGGLKNKFKVTDGFAAKIKVGTLMTTLFGENWDVDFGGLQGRQTSILSGVRGSSSAAAQAGGGSKQDGNIKSALARPPAGPKQHLITLFFFEIYQTLVRNEMSVQQAFDALDAGHKGYISFNELRQALQDVFLTSAEQVAASRSGDTILLTAAELGVKESWKCSFESFQQCVDFDTTKFELCFDRVFADELSLELEKFEKGLAAEDIPKFQVRNFLQLIYPNGIPRLVDKASCETFLRTNISLMLNDPTMNYKGTIQREQIIRPSVQMKYA